MQNSFQLAIEKRLRNTANIPDEQKRIKHRLVRL